MTHHRALIAAAGMIALLSAGCALSDDAAAEINIDLPLETMDGPGGMNGNLLSATMEMPAICQNVPTLGAQMLGGPNSDLEIHPWLENYYVEPQFAIGLVSHLTRFFSHVPLAAPYGEVYPGESLMRFDWATTPLTQTQMDNAARIMLLFTNDNGSVPINVYGPDVNYSKEAQFPVMVNGRPRLVIDGTTYVHEYAVCNGGCQPSFLFSVQMGQDTVDILNKAAGNSGPPSQDQVQGWAVKRFCVDPDAECPIRDVEQAVPADGSSPNLTYVVDPDGRVIGATATGGHVCHLSFVPESALPSLYPAVFQNP